MARTLAQRLSRWASFGLLALGFLVVSAGPAGAAGSGYSPAPPTSPTPTPSGCPSGTVVTSLNLPAGGGSVSAPVGGVNVTVTVPAGSFPAGAQVAIIDTSTIAIAPTGDTIVLAFGVDFCVNGAKFTGTFSPPATITVADPAIKAGDTLYQQVGSTLILLPNVQVSNGSLTFTIDSDPDFVLVTATTTGGLIPGATTVVTGKPFLLEEVVGGLFVAIGGVLLMLFVRLRLRHR
jgi:hypothetical protein